MNYINRINTLVEAVIGGFIDATNINTLEAYCKLYEVDLYDVRNKLAIRELQELNNNLEEDSQS